MPAGFEGNQIKKSQNVRHTETPSVTGQIMRILLYYIMQLPCVFPQCRKKMVCIIKTVFFLISFKKRDCWCQKKQKAWPLDTCVAFHVDRGWEVSCNLSLAFSQSNCVSFSAEYGAVLAVLKDNFCKCGKTSSLPYGIFFNLLKLFATLRAHCTVIWYVYAKFSSYLINLSQLP